MKSSPSGSPLGESPAHGKIMPDPAEQSIFCTQDTGYRGMWHGQPAYFEPYGWKYGGGLSTYSCKHRPLAHYCPAVDKTFFCYGATKPNDWQRDRVWDFEEGHLLHAVGYFDHRTGLLTRPTIVFDKWCADPHDNPVLQVDDSGYLWLFSPSHGDWTTRSFIHRSEQPYSIARWRTISDAPLHAYPQPWFHAERKWFFFHTAYGQDAIGRAGRSLYFKRSRDGIDWEAPTLIADIEQGHYQVSQIDQASGKVGTAFDIHPDDGGLEARTNLYYIESADWGASWQTSNGSTIQLPMRGWDSSALIYDARSQGELVYIKDLIFDAAGNPIILFLTSRGHQLGPEYGPHTWRLAWFRDGQWEIEAITESTNNYDYGSLYLDDHGQLSLIGATEVGPQPYTTGGELALWTRSQSGTWSLTRQLTSNSPRNHTYPRSVCRAHPDFVAFWADGNGKTASESRLYFCNQAGDVFLMPNESTSSANETLQPKRM